MIVAESETARREAIMKLLPHQKKDFYGILKAMAPHPVTIRLLDPPLHEFLPQAKEQIDKLARALQITSNELNRRIEILHPPKGIQGRTLSQAAVGIYNNQDYINLYLVIFLYK